MIYKAMIACMICAGFSFPWWAFVLSGTVGAISGYFDNAIRQTINKNQTTIFQHMAKRV